MALLPASAGVESLVGTTVPNLVRNRYRRTDRKPGVLVRIVVVGPGRAGGSLAVAAHEAGHEIAGLLARRADDQEVASHLGMTAGPLGSRMPPADLLILAVRDDSIGQCASVIARDAALASRIGSTVHLSGLVSTGVLDPLHRIGLDTGAFHPLQTLPDWRTGAKALQGAQVGITAAGGLAERLEDLADSLGCQAFRLPDPAKALYHAAAVASTNFVLVALEVAGRLFRKAGVDPRVARPLVEQTIANAFDIGVAASVTGPIVRGDIGTVEAHLEAVHRHSPESGELFLTLVGATAERAGTADLMEDLLV